MENDITYLGKIIRVDSDTVEVEVSDKIPSSSPIIEGRVYKIGQIGTFVKIVAGNIVSYGLVSSVSNAPSKDNIQHDVGSRFLTVNLIGEKIGNRKFEKGIGLFPTINDEAHIVTENDLSDIYGNDSEKIGGQFPIGKHASSDNLDVFIDVHNLVLRHSAILGSTGSGKSNSVVAIIKRMYCQLSNSRVVLIDPHGEYSSAFPDAKVFKINDFENPLYIPFWLMNFDELLYFLVGAKPSDESKPEYRRLREMITNEKKNNCNLKAGSVDPNCITADSPIPFNIRKIWYDMNRELNATYKEAQSDKQIGDAECLIKEGNHETLEPAQFKAYSMSNKEPYRSKRQEMYSYEKKILSKLRDSRFDFMFNPDGYENESSKNDLHNLLQMWIGSSERLAILDLSNVPFELIDITVGIITRFVYDSMFWGKNEKYTGRQRPLLVAYEEAHSYLGKNETHYALNAVEKVFKEGRKFGLGAMVISQRPSELSETILAQVGTFIALRLSNSSDQSIVKSMAPDNMNSLINLLPSLRIGEAVVIGESINIPSRVRLPLQSPRPDSADPNLVEEWNRDYESSTEDYKSVVTKIREQHF